MTTLAALLLLAPAPSPVDDLLHALRNYQKLDSFSATVEHQDASGLYPGHYTENLKWRKDGRFELKTVQKSDFKPVEHNPGTIAPDWYCDGSYVAWIDSGMPKRTTPITPDPNTSPGWEVSGGPILSSLMKTPSLDQ
ncbi:MAG TPA: hypothetical protein VG820_12145, partial [Fimbriimonadaceae bacterium]|nr:hypothetical protein [Fimbriimonadaceae bacterium]